MIRNGWAEDKLEDIKARLCAPHPQPCKAGLARRDHHDAPQLPIKDLNNVLETARGIDVPTPLTAEVMAMMQSLKDEGMGDADHSALVRYYEKIAGIERQR